MGIDHDKRIIVYPHYVNSALTVAEGRRIPKVTGCENPTAREVYDCLVALHLDAELENKAYCRDAIVRGRVRVRLLDESGLPVNPTIPNRRALLTRLAETLPKHPLRIKRAKDLDAASRAKAAAPAPNPAKRGSKKKR